MAESLQAIKQRFGIIGNNPNLNMAIERAMQVANTDISVLITGESGVGKEFFPKIIHALSLRKHNTYIAVNCGAIPEGTIDSELFGHEKGAFTGATQTRKGYFEEANGGTIFLDEVGELPLHTQVRLLRVLETGEFMKVGSSNVQKTNVRIVAATNVNVLDAVQKGKFREDLYYRLNTVEIKVPALRERPEDIPLLFRKFAIDFAEKYRRPVVKLTPQAEITLSHYAWPGNVRQLRNFAEEVSVVETREEVGAEEINKFLPTNSIVPVKSGFGEGENDFSNERELLYKFLFDMKKDLNDLRALTLQLLSKNHDDVVADNKDLVNRVLNGYTSAPDSLLKYEPENIEATPTYPAEVEDYDYEDIPENNSLSLQDNEIDLIEKALQKHSGKRKEAAEELGISERTLYRKIKQYGL
ncbi:sigma-54-dependent Fis family transcriptional regulator [Ornithobacterium rhinotracheale]|uniref:sigma-54 interaction domain-containing protein n=1 Tax=Ornithobacterium rhinotracheale TaxID=28251 RepID=UPI00129C8F49|nr:sigma-54 dependent transcriptional regulator [Ornithobacterium rhinotracheale]MRJ08225.1 sigma-54-dependent Fis family transcriptional regulator [Ornithobacterium rhinotracheale]UOH77421.1 sigma-54 dependent transcriptional regulator [Ornithobacterium rhinotracheale]